MSEYKAVSEFRKDIVSGDWILVAAGRRNRPGAENLGSGRREQTPIENCPFEDPEERNETAVLWYGKPENVASENLKDWFLRVVPNKFPVLKPHRVCPSESPRGPFQIMDGIGFHEVIITRDHEKTIADMTEAEIELILRAYRERSISIKNEDCIEYVLIFHNYGPKAGASIFHPHSQLIALPIIPPDVTRSIGGSLEYFEKNKICVHCVILDFELKEKIRVIYENDDFVAFCPFASHVSSEIRIYPKAHGANFEDINPEIQRNLAGVFKTVFKKLRTAMHDPDYNFFIHTAPAKISGRSNDMSHYHWHIEILPRTSTWAGLELGTGIEVVAVAPEEAAETLRNL